MGLLRSANAVVLLALLLCCSLPALSSAYYFVLTRYSPLASRFGAQQGSIGGARGDTTASTQLHGLADELDVGHWARPLSLLMDKRAAAAQQQQKRSAAATKTLPVHEHVCSTVIRTDYRPAHGHEQNGTRVEIQQDERRQFSATFVECASTKREHCHGIDNALFSSECVTVYEFRPAGVRLEGSSNDFAEGLVKVPITCQCRLRRKIGNGILP